MTTQILRANVGNASMMKAFTDTATDDTWDSNIMLDDIASQPLGLLIPNIVIDRINVLYTAGLCAWRIQQTDNLAVKRHGWASKSPLNNPNEGFMASLTINPKDTLQVYPRAVDATSGDTACLAWVTAGNATELFAVTTSADNTLAELVGAVTGSSIGDTFFGSVVTHIEIQSEDGANIIQMDLVDNTGGTIYTQRGGQRGAYVGAMNLVTNLDCKNLNLKIGKGYSLKVKTTTA